MHDAVQLLGSCSPLEPSPPAAGEPAPAQPSQVLPQQPRPQQPLQLALSHPVAAPAVSAVTPPSPLHAGADPRARAPPVQGKQNGTSVPDPAAGGGVQQAALQNEIADGSAGGAAVQRRLAALAVASGEAPAVRHAAFMLLQVTGSAVFRLGAA